MDNVTLYVQIKLWFEHEYGKVIILALNVPTWSPMSLISNISHLGWIEFDSYLSQLSLVSMYLPSYCIQQEDQTPSILSIWTSSPSTYLLTCMCIYMCVCVFLFFSFLFGNLQLSSHINLHANMFNFSRGMSWSTCKCGWQCGISL